MPSETTLTTGAYTLPDAARLLGLPLPRLRSWIRGKKQADSAGGRDRWMPAGELSSVGLGLDRHFGFQTLIELFVIGQLRRLGVSMRRVREARSELAARFGTDHPFALEGLLTDGKSLLVNLGEGVLLELGKLGQTAFQEVLERFCQRLDFDDATRQATRFYPEGRESTVVVDPRHAFGRPSMAGTNIATEAIASLVRGGEEPDVIAADFRVDPKLVHDAWRFESRLAA